MFLHRIVLHTTSISNLFISISYMFTGVPSQHRSFAACAAENGRFTRAMTRPPPYVVLLAGPQGMEKVTVENYDQRSPPRLLSARSRLGW